MCCLYLILAPASTEDPDEVTTSFLLIDLKNAKTWIQSGTHMCFQLLQPPCRTYITTLIEGHDAHVFKKDDDIYMPNCDKRGFFRKKQVSLQNERNNKKPFLRMYGCIPSWKTIFLFALFEQCMSSRAKRRGKCWCVDQKGVEVPSKTKQKGPLSCWMA